MSLWDDFMSFFDDFKFDDKLYNYIKYILSCSNLLEKKFYVKNGNIKSYYPLYIGDALENDLFQEIILGPACKQNIDDLIMFLKSKGLNIKIRKSTVSINS